ncbi:MAG: phosphatase PAP2 family protein [Candidatus Saccharimonadales bacterium]
MDSLIIFCGKYLFVALPLLVLLAWAQANKKYKIELPVAVIIAGIIAVILDKLGSKLYYDPRPFVTHHLKPLIAHAADNGFPSEHTIFTITLATVLIFYRPKLGTLAFIIGLVVGSARVAAHIHSPIDIIGGIVMGAVAGYLGYYLAIKLLKSKADKGNLRNKSDTVTPAGKQVPDQADKRQD